MNDVYAVREVVSSGGDTNETHGLVDSPVEVDNSWEVMGLSGIASNVEIATVGGDFLISEQGPLLLEPVVGVKFASGSDPSCVPL